MIRSNIKNPARVRHVFLPRISHKSRNTRAQREERGLHNCSNEILFEDRSLFNIWMSLDIS